MKAEILKRLILLAELLPRQQGPLSESALDIYTEALCKYSEDQIILAFNQATKTLDWFPSIKQLTEFIEGSGSDKALIAWGAVMDGIKKGGSWGKPKFDPVTESALRSLGGWETLCNTPANKLSISSAQFQKAFTAAAKNPHLVISGPEERKQISGPAHIGNFMEKVEK